MQNHFDAIYRSLRENGAWSWQSRESFSFVSEDIPGHLTALGAQPHDRILEVGCGDGEIAMLLSGLGYEVSGVDCSQVAVDWGRSKAAERGLEVGFVHGDARFLDAFDDESFDYVVDGAVFHCMLDADRGTFLKAVRRVLRPGGSFHVRTVCGEVCDSDIRRYFNESTRNIVNADDDGSSEFFYYHQGFPTVILQELEQHGFTINSYDILEREEQGNCDLLIANATG